MEKNDQGKSIQNCVFDSLLPPSPSFSFYSDAHAVINSY